MSNYQIMYCLDCRKRATMGNRHGEDFRIWGVPADDAEGNPKQGEPERFLGEHTGHRLVMWSEYVEIIDIDEHTGKDVWAYEYEDTK